METPSADHNNKKMLREPLLKTYKKGGFTTLPFIIANEAFEKVASMGLIPNMILYLTREYNMEAANGANVLYLWSATTNFMPVFGAFLADSFVGRYRMIGFGSMSSLLGMILLWLTTTIPQARPKPCDQLGETCESATTLQLLLLYSSFAFMSIGAGGIRSSSLAFGAEQIVESDNHNTARMLESFFSWYYVMVSVSVIIAMTCVVYIQDAKGWTVGYGIPVLLMILSTLSFFMASPYYVKSKPDSSLFTGFAQVLAASFRKRNVEVSSRAAKYYHRNGSKLLVPTEHLRFLNKACMITYPEEALTADGNAYDTWHLCTVDQVEELKRLIKIVPIWSTGVLASVTVSQGSFAVLQTSTLDRHFTANFEIPAGSFTAFLLLTLLIWVALYDRIIIPFASKMKGKRVGLSLMQKMGIGILFSSASMAAIATLEGIRRKLAIKEGFADNPKATLDISAMWLLPYHIFAGLTEAFNAIGQNEFYYTELPKSMSSVATSLFLLGLSVANLMASSIVNTVDYFTKIAGQESWVSSNINKGHLDYYYWLLAGLSLVNLIYYIGCCKAYGRFSNTGNQVQDDNEGIEEDSR